MKMVALRAFEKFKVGHFTMWYSSFILHRRKEITTSM